MAEKEIKLLPACHANAEKLDMIWVCSGAANVGKIGHEVGIKLTNEDYGRLCCVTALGADSKVHLEIAKNAKRNIVINGCANHCASKVIEKHGFKIDHEFDISKFLKKTATSDYYEADVEQIAEHIIKEAKMQKHKDI